MDHHGRQMSMTQQYEEPCYDTDEDLGTDPSQLQETEGSPTASAVSVSSVAPTLVSALLSQHMIGTPHFYDLTPVTRNTYATTDGDNGEASARERLTNPNMRQNSEAVLVSPPEIECFQHQVFRPQNRDLSLPGNEDEADDDEHMLPHRLSSGLPPMRVTRAQSLTQAGMDRDIDVPIFESSTQEEGLVSSRPVPFAERTRFFSFSNREQYRDTTSIRVQQLQRRQQLQRHPYYPSRNEDAMDELPPKEELSRIFASRRRNEDDEDDSKAHRLGINDGQRPLLMVRGQGSDSVPSLRLAHRLSGTTDSASVTTHTTLNTLGEEEDDSFLDTSQHGSWSSQQPALVEDAHEVNTSQEGVPSSPLPRHCRKGSDTPSVVLEGCLDDEIPFFQEQAANDSAPVVDADNDTTMAVDGRQLREQEALEWLQSLQVAPGIAEAASSKFLCSSAATTASSISPA